MPIPYLTARIPEDAPADLDRSQGAIDTSMALAKASPWMLSEHDLWRLDVPHLWFAISQIVARNNFETVSSEAKVLAFGKWLLLKRHQDFRGQQAAAQISMRDLAIVIGEQVAERWARGDLENSQEN